MITVSGAVRCSVASHRVHVLTVPGFQRVQSGGDLCRGRGVRLRAGAPPPLSRSVSAWARLSTRSPPASLTYPPTRFLPADQCWAVILLVLHHCQK